MPAEIIVDGARILLYASVLAKVIARFVPFILGLGLGMISVWLAHLATGPISVEHPTTETPIICSLIFDETPAAPVVKERSSVVQSSVVTFPTLGKVDVKAIETVGNRPKMEFSSVDSHKKLLIAEIKDKDDLFTLYEHDDGSDGPYIRYRVLDHAGLPAPVIMSVVMYPGGSDDGFYLSLFTEINGRIVNITPKPHGLGVQGGWHLGYLGPKYGYGLAEWSFIWRFGEEGHYSSHRYLDETYTFTGTHFIRVLKRTSRHKYDPAYGYKSLGELGISVKDQRIGIPYFRDYLEVEP
jgi:hypothetical protein